MGVALQSAGAWAAWDTAATTAAQPPRGAEGRAYVGADPGTSQKTCGSSGGRFRGVAAELGAPEVISFGGRRSPNILFVPRPYVRGRRTDSSLIRPPSPSPPTPSRPPRQEIQYEPIRSPAVPVLKIALSHLHPVVASQPCRSAWRAPFAICCATGTAQCTRPARDCNVFRDEQAVTSCRMNHA
jgi:hypothetical protein